MQCAKSCLVRTKAKIQIALILLPGLLAASPVMAEPLQRFHCEGPVLTKVEIHEDITRKDGYKLVSSIRMALRGTFLPSA